MTGIKITFINPPFLKNFSRPQRSPAVTKSGTLYYPMWLSYAAGFSEQAGHEIDLIDAPAATVDKDTAIKRITTFGSQLIVVETSTPSIFNDIQFCEDLKKETDNLFIVLVGTHVSALPEESLALSRDIDAIAVGEFDQTVCDIANCLKSGGNISDIPGLCYRSSTGPQRTEERSFLEELDQVPMVSAIYKRFLDINNYFNPNALFPMVTITTSRGCPHKCIFCVYPQTMMGHRLRLRSVKNVVDEVQYIVDNFPLAKAIFFEDDTFPAQKKRCIEICQEIIRRKIKISWTANARVDLDYETLQIMKNAGCRCLCVGFESGNQHLLDNIKKRITLEQSQSFMIAARKAKILVHGCFMVGLPGETEDTMENTLQLAIDLKPDAVQFYPVMVYPGTEAYDWYDKKDLIATRNFSQWLTPSGLHNTVIRGEELSSAELVAFCDKARRSFYLRPAYIFYKLLQMIRNPKEIKRTIKSARTFFLHLLKGSDTECQKG